MPLAVAAAAAGAAAARGADPSGTEGGAQSPQALPDLARKGIEEFNRGEFYECHEYLEEAWMQEPRRVRFLYQGILQVGVGFYHLKNGNWRGAVGLLRGGTERLREFEPEALGVDVTRLVEEARACLAELEKLGRNRVREFDLAEIPRVHFVDGTDAA